MTNLELIKKLYDIGAIKFGEFTLKSGKKSPYYIDLRILPSYPTVLIEAAKNLATIIKSQTEKPSRLCGVPMAGLAITNALGIETGIPVMYTRKEPIIYRDLAKQLKIFIQEGKYHQHEVAAVERIIETIEELSGFKTHGITRYIDGVIKDGDNIAIVDDLITTADSKLEARHLIMLEAKRRKINVDVIRVYVLLDREQGGNLALIRKGLELYSVATMSEVAEGLCELGVLPLEKYQIIVDYIASEKMQID